MFRVEKPHLPYLAHNAQIDSIAVIHTERDGEEGRIECSFDLQCHRLAEIMGLYIWSREIVIST